MFDFGFSELLLVAVIALLVLGPERLPRAARVGGLWLRRARASWYSMKAQVERELADDELRRSLRDTREQIHGLRRELEQPLPGAGPVAAPTPVAAEAAAGADPAPAEAIRAGEPQADPGSADRAAGAREPEAGQGDRSGDAPGAGDSGRDPPSP